eukprot:TRINITY_DN14011_c0_g1_i6.p3 TRINITY_DN14011_c0_g1~~TRINITY_DN14011_c0_g1_i6.p3  ORF type:complete len:125 (-),score=9.08 TRINITY_DN14011_c0_g1_i6:177-551(-)
MRDVLKIYNVKFFNSCNIAYVSVCFSYQKYKYGSIVESITIKTWLVEKFLTRVQYVRALGFFLGGGGGAPTSAPFEMGTAVEFVFHKSSKLFMQQYKLCYRCYRTCFKKKFSANFFSYDLVFFF